MSNKIIIGVVAVIVIGGAWYFMSRGDEQIGGAVTSPEQETKYTDPQSGEVALEGKLACTPLKSGEAVDADECVIGLQGNDGKFYALDTSAIEIISKGIDTNTNVRAVGSLTKVDSGSEEAGIFAYDGVIKARVLQAAQ
jgi:hypothetical protein